MYEVLFPSGVMSPGSDAILLTLLDELAEGADAEHPDVAVQHESGLTLTILGRWRLVVENVETDFGPFWVDLVDRAAVVAAMLDVTVGSLALLDRITTWQPGYGPAT